MDRYKITRIGPWNGYVILDRKKLKTCLKDKRYTDKLFSSKKSARLYLKKGGKDFTSEQSLKFVRGMNEIRAIRIEVDTYEEIWTAAYLGEEINKKMIKECIDHYASADDYESDYMKKKHVTVSIIKKRGPVETLSAFDFLNKYKEFNI